MNAQIKIHFIIMNTQEISAQLYNLVNNLSPETFIYDLLSIYGKPKASISRLQKGDLNISKRDDEVLWKKQICFREVATNDLYSAPNKISQEKYICKNNPRFIIASDYKTLIARDTKTNQTLDIPIDCLPENSDFFLPLAGREKTAIHKEHEADIKATKKMAAIYDEICKNNPNMRPQQDGEHALNVFLSRLLFCFFADTTEIFQKNLFIETLCSFTEENGSNLHAFFGTLFEKLNTAVASSKFPTCLQNFPYVNGGLFKESFAIPKFTSRLRKMIIECGKLDWSYINPDIFGSMIQAVVDPSQRTNLGMHYTSVPNIMKVIRPLFLDNLYEELKLSEGNKKKLHELYQRLGNIQIFDPACGSGNFLIIAYKELRLFEIQLLKQLEAIGRHPTFFSQVQLSQFYGIEIDEFACRVAKLSLWIAEHQLNKIAERTFHKWSPSLPLKEGGRIVCGNATRLDWEKVCIPDKNKEIYILGNPPYRGASLQSSEQKNDMSHVFNKIKNFKNLDYISCWFVKAANYINLTPKSQMSFVTTTSICQGEQVALLWNHILENNLEISFAYRSFKWSNNAKMKAGVVCSIIGIRKTSFKPKYLFNDSDCIAVNNITPYLHEGKNIILDKRKKPISKLPIMSYGSKPVDDGNFILTKNEKNKLINTYPKASQIIRKFMGSEEFINGKERWCLWITENDLADIELMQYLETRILKVRKFRLNSQKKATVKSSDFPWQFGEIRFQNSNSIIIPSVSSENREYLQVGFLDKSTVISNSAHAIYDADLVTFGILSCKMHMIWLKTVCGYLGTSIRYSSSLCYNNFPVPIFTENQKKNIEKEVYNVIKERQKHPEKTIAELYDPKKMPSELRKAHQNLDAAVEHCYSSQPFKNDEERLEHLFQLYEKMTQNDKGN